MVDSTQRNAWVDKYLTALLGDGLSKEYVAGDEDGADNDAVAANYFFNLIIDDEEDGIVASWRRAKSAVDSADPAAVRRENQAWRIWSLKLAREEVRRAAATAPAADDDGLADADADPTPDADPDTDVDVLPPIVPPPAGKSGNPGATARQPSVGPSLGGPGLPVIRTTAPAGGPGSDADAGGQSPGTAMSGMSDQAVADNPFFGRVDRLYVVLSSVHGLVRGENMELGKDADTGGQVKYVVELARTLAHHPMVYRVDLLTRLIEDPAVAPDYGLAEERLSEDDGNGSLRGAYIVRVPAGDPKVYLPKEQLWPHIREFADGALDYVAQMQQRLQREAAVPVRLFAVHGHYADAGEAAALMAHTLGVPMVLTGHSLGRNKLDHLLRSGTTTRKQIEETYAISRRIEGEERALDAALMVITSTEQEVEQQWGLYDGYEGEMAAALHYRIMAGRAMPHMEVIPPGLDFSSLKVELPADPMQLFEDLERSMNPADDVSSASGAVGVTGGPSGPSDLRDDDLVSGGSSPAGSPRHGGGESLTGANPSSLGGSFARNMPGRSASRTGMSKAISSASLMAMESLRNEPEIWTSVHRFLRNPAKPVVLAMSRPDAKKNITTLVRAFGENAELRRIANLVLVMGNRHRIDGLAKGSQQVLTAVLKLIDDYDLYGSVAYPKAHSQQDISDIYLLAKETRGVFVNIALQEPFGLTLIEAAVHGAPIVATRHGGPVDIINTLKNGKLVEPTDAKAVSAAIKDIIIKTDKWNRYSGNGIKNILAYSWPSHCIRYLKAIQMHRDDDGGGGGLQRVLTQSRLRHSIDDSIAAIADVEGIVALGDLRKGADFPGRMRHFNSSMPPDSLPFAMDDTAAPTGGAHRNELQPELARVDSAAPAQPRLRILSRTRLAYAMMDTTFDMALLATALRSVLRLNDGSVGVGLLTVLTFNEVVEELKNADVAATDLDFIVCNCGAYIMYVDSEGNWKADEAWEAKAMYRWDKKLVMRTLTRMQMNRPPGKGEVQRSDLMRLLSAADGVDMNDGAGPIHVLLDFDPQSNEPLEKMDNAVLIDRVRKRVRRVGVRCNLTLQLVPEETTAERTRSVLHATPLRSSRALALRHIVHVGNFMMADTVFLCTPASMHAKVAQDGHTVVGALCSDMATLVEGAQKVVVVPPSKLPRLSKQDVVTGEPGAAPETRYAAAFERLKVSLKPFSPDRVLVLNAASELEERLKDVLSTPPVAAAPAGANTAGADAPAQD